MVWDAQVNIKDLLKSGTLMLFGHSEVAAAYSL